MERAVQQQQTLPTSTNDNDYATKIAGLLHKLSSVEHSVQLRKKKLYLHEK